MSLNANFDPVNIYYGQWNCTTHSYQQSSIMLLRKNRRRRTPKQTAHGRGNMDSVNSNSGLPISSCDLALLITLTINYFLGDDDDDRTATQSDAKRRRLKRLVMSLPREERERIKRIRVRIHAVISFLDDSGFPGRRANYKQFIQKMLT